ncbi:MBL fold metallo-hydrolase [Chromatocurvus halotolerans]|uniref:Ribonuclease BN (tRNA processing enzyme) n=1 Tax=Chromatocurvus halotolerans TaxID=1132028 RepID=A0A4R2KY82_9GAMM|nr:MBL fold metallo-hydrolase [Chromatocurvus halotolerans]TCO77857.1 ribonuclease BN (tRNA processing enzyme) [Chromatocurvus halotolerans]
MGTILRLVVILVLTAGRIQESSAGDCVGIRVQVLGSGGPEIDDGRSSSSYLLWQGDSARLLLDAGSGSSLGFGSAGARFADLDAILLSHLHTDHSVDIPAFIKGSFFTDRNTNLVIAGPAGNDRMPRTSTFMKRLIGPDGAFRYLSSYLEDGTEAYTLSTLDMPAQSVGHLSGEGWHASSLPVRHGPIPALAWRADLGGCVVVYAGDMSGAPETFTAFARNADLLILHAAVPENAGATARRLHMIPSELVSLANQLTPERILLSHFMKRSEQEAPESFQRMVAPVVLARDGLSLDL